MKPFSPCRIQNGLEELSVRTLNGRPHAQLRRASFTELHQHTNGKIAKRKQPTMKRWVKETLHVRKIQDPALESPQRRESPRESDYGLTEGITAH